MLNAGGVAGFLQVHPEIDEIKNDLDMSLRLHLSAHHAKADEWLAIFCDERRNDRVKGSLVRRVAIQLAFLEVKKRSAILERKAKPIGTNARSKSKVEALDE